jgi:tRNA A-37 threonylcarbamoyl transferase component Bud32
MTTPTPERWRRIQELCDLVEPLAPADRTRLLRELEPDDSLREDALGLLTAMADEEREQRAQPGSAVSSDTASLPGSIGGVRIEAFLGAGGSGEVYRGVRTLNGTNQTVAVKRFHRHRASDDDLDRFAREQRVLATLTHPAIVRFFDAGVESDGCPYLVMELAEGRPLVEFCDELEMTLPARLRMFLRVCEAVESAHKHGVLHLDLKPSNIIALGPATAAYVKLVDFGTAKLTGHDRGATRTEPLTVRYASPERLRGDDVSAACDVYSLGLILFELASGGWPFRRPDTVVTVAERSAGTAAQTRLTRAVTDEAARRRGVTADRLRSVLRGDLDAITSKALAHNPQHRYPSVAELVADVCRYLDGQAIHALPAPAVSHLRRWMQRQRKAVVASTAAAIVVGAAMFYAGSRAVAQPADTPASPVPAALAQPIAAEAKEPIWPIPPGGQDAQTSLRILSLPTGSTVYDDFVMKVRTAVAVIRWTGIYCQGDKVTTEPAKGGATAFVVAIHADAGGRPRGDRSLWSATYPIERLSETYAGMRMARCGLPVPTAYSYHRYTATLDSPFVAEAGTRYWLSVQAQVARPRTDPDFVFWGWLSGPGLNRHSIQVNPQGAAVEHPRDRDFVLGPR